MARVVLPTSVVPKAYDVSLTPNLTDFTFDGVCHTTIDIKEKTNRVTTNALCLKIHKCSCRGIPSALIELDESRGEVTFVFAEPLDAGDAVLTTEFTGELNDKMRGFYRSKDGEQWMAVTQFEATDARRAFPCWDEPALKATFKISLKVPSHLTAISNMPIVQEVLQGETKTVVYEESPRMSTYLVAFVVGEFDYVEDSSSDIIVRVYTPKGKTDRASFALHVAVESIKFYCNYFGVNYPLPKMDLIAIPDFAAGAMENFGCVTYAENALLVDKDLSSAANRQSIALTVAHEVAHQWFGNLVTMDWWDDLWLNEGFASWIENLATDAIHPEFGVWPQFVCDVFCYAQVLDSRENTHPVHVNVGNPEEVEEIFDAISYDKGSSIVRMLENHLSPEVFRAGLQNYMSKHKWENATTTNLWEALSAASGKDVSALMDSWVNKPGYPVLQVEKVDGETIAIRQHRFISSIRNQCLDDTVWYLPIYAAVGDDEKRGEATHHEISTSEGTLKIKVEQGQWVKLNYGQYGFYRVNYTEEMWRDLVKPIRSKVLGPEDRLGLQNDAMALCMSGLFPAPNLLELWSAYRDETEYIVWDKIATNIEKVSRLVSSPQLDQYTLHLFAKIGSHLGWDADDNEDHTTPLLRSAVLKVLGLRGHQPTIEEAKQRFYDSSVTNADLDGVIACITLRHGGQEAYDRVIERYETSEFQEEQIRMLRALGYASDPALLSRSLRMSLSDKVRFKDSITLIVSVARASVIGGELAWQHVKDNWAEIFRRYGEGGFGLTELVLSSAGGFSSEEMHADVKAFFDKNPCPAANRAIQQSMEQILAHSAWIKQEKEQLTTWLRRNAEVLAP